jgi:hypothetical protein
VTTTRKRNVPSLDGDRITATRERLVISDKIPRDEAVPAHALPADVVLQREA